MSLKRYLLTIYALTLGGLLVICALMADDSEFPLVGMLMMSPLFALANTFVNIWPWARMVPEERRTSFRAYKATNIFMGFLGALLLLSITLKLADLLTR